MRKNTYIKFFTYLLFPFFILNSTLVAQTILRGKVVDSDTKEPLVGANILVQGTNNGNVSDIDGAFEIQTAASFPLKLVFSFTGYITQIIDVANNNQEIVVNLSSDALSMDIVEVRGQRITDKQKQSPLTIEALDNIAIKETASDNFYDGLGSLKGVDLTAASLGFKVINTRGFNSTSPVRSLQIIDGLDNQAPGLNFSLGNFLGSSELDVNRVDLIVGASSAFYGPSAFNGVISMETKDPFFHTGLSALVKTGERNLLETAIRWGDAIKNKNNQDVFGYKLNFSYLRADDWVADNYDPVDGSLVEANNPGRYDAVNIYGDEYQRGNDFSTFAPWQYPGLGTWYRTGYEEKDLVNYNTRNLKASFAAHWRLDPAKMERSPEVIVSSSFGTGTTVYQGDNRFSLRGITFLQNRVEIKKRDRFFVRAYSTRTGAGDSYDPYFTALELLERAKDDRTWSQDYANYWLRNVNPKILNDGFPQVSTTFNPLTGTIEFQFDKPKADQWLIDNYDRLVQWHSEAEVAANTKTIGNSSVDFFSPGTARFEETFDEIAGTLRTEGGTKFFDNSALYHTQGEYVFNPYWMDKITVGASARLYAPNSKGTVFYDTAGINITNFEYGIYAGFEKSFFAKQLKAQVTVRTDKNENYNRLFSPAASLVWTPNEKDYLRVSFSSAIRNPTLTDQYLFLNVGRAILAGNLEGADSLITVESLTEYFKQPRPNVLQYFDIAPVKPEQVNTFEAGYRTTLFDNTFVDAGYYYSIYNNFLGFNIGVEGDFDARTGLPLRLQAYRYAANSVNTVTTQGLSIGVNHYFAQYYMVNSNYSWNKLIKAADDDPIIPAFNTPEHKFNVGLSARDIDLDLGIFILKKFGFKVNYKWIEGFLFEGSPQFTGFIPTYDLMDVQANVNFPKIHTTLKIGASNVLNNKSFQTYGGPRIGRLAYISLVYEQGKK